MRAPLLIALSLSAGCQAPLQGTDPSDPYQCKSPPPVVTSASGGLHQYQVNSLNVPLTRDGFAYDLTCQGKSYNQLGSIMAALETAEVGEQGKIDAAIDDGSLVLLIGLTTDDLASAEHAGVTLQAGKRMSGDFGEYKLTVDDTVPATSFLGRIDGATFRSNPQNTSPPLSLALRIPVPGAIVTLPVVDAHIEFTTGTDGSTGAPGLLAGRINGGVRPDDFRAAVLPAFAAFFTQELKDDPADHALLEEVFDIGGCEDAGIPARAKDLIITPCELASDQIIANVIAADVQLFDSDGTFNPGDPNAAKDVISIGLGFTAVQASF